MRLPSLVASFLLLLCAMPARADAVADLQAILGGLRTLQGEFTQTVVSRSGKNQVSSGRVAIQRPGKFRWNYRKPYEQLIVGDGKDVWLYDPDLNQVTVKQIDKALDASPAALLSGDNQLEKRYRLKSLPARNGLSWVEAVPRQNDNNFNRVRIGFINKSIRRMELEDSFGQTTHVDFHGLVANGRVDAGQFRFTPPKGADVVRQ